MSLLVKVQKMKVGDNSYKWFGKAVKRGDMNMKDIAAIISSKNSVTESDVYGVLIALVKEMKNFMQMGQTIHLDGLGNFHLTIESEMVDNQEDYRLSEHVKRVRCKFTPSAHRVNGKLYRDFCADVDLEKL